MMSKLPSIHARLRQPGWWWAPLWPAYAMLTAIRQLAYDRGWLPVHRLKGPQVIAVGGLEAGGSGKTPVTALLLAMLHDAGFQPGLLSRGHKRASKGLVVRLPHEPIEPSQIGDEPAMIVEDMPNLPVAIAKRRIEGALELLRLGCTHVVLDDGFSHRALGRDTDIVVLRAEAPFGNGHLLPWGTLREPKRALRRATVVWLHAKSGMPVQEPPWWWQQWCPNARFVSSIGRLKFAVDSEGRSVALKGKALIAASGVARPADFHAELQRLGARLCHAITFADHHSYSPSDVANMLHLMRLHGAEYVVVTAKDAVKLRRLWPDQRLLVAPMEVHIVCGQQVVADVLGVALPPRA